MKYIDVRFNAEKNKWEHEPVENDCWSGSTYHKTGGWRGKIVKTTDPKIAKSKLAKVLLKEIDQRINKLEKSKKKLQTVI